MLEEMTELFSQRPNQKRIEIYAEIICETMGTWLTPKAFAETCKRIKNNEHVFPSLAKIREYAYQHPDWITFQEKIKQLDWESHLRKVKNEKIREARLRNLALEKLGGKDAVKKFLFDWFKAKYPHTLSLTKNQKKSLEETVGLDWMLKMQRCAFFDLEDSSWNVKKALQLNSKDLFLKNVI